MKKSRFSEAVTGMNVREVCRKHGTSPATYYAWKSKYGGPGVSELKRIRELKAENAELKRMYADASLVRDALQKLLSRELSGR